MTPLGCGEFRDVAPDLALGLLAGDERGAALNHVAGCDTCRSHLDGLAEVADELLLLAPSVEPEIGFESRVVARLHAEGAFPAPAAEERVAVGTPLPTRSRRRPSRAVLLGIAAALIVVAGVTGLGAGLARGRSQGQSRAVGQAVAAKQLQARTVVVRADSGRSTCQLVAFPATGTQPARLVIMLDEVGQTPESYLVVAEPTRGGAPVTVGTITMAHGHGTLVAAIPAGAGPVDGVRIMDSPASVRYHATFQSV